MIVQPVLLCAHGTQNYDLDLYNSRCRRIPPLRPLTLDTAKPKKDLPLKDPVARPHRCVRLYFIVRTWPLLNDEGPSPECLCCYPSAAFLRPGEAEFCLPALFKNVKKITQPIMYVVFVQERRKDPQEEVAADHGAVFLFVDDRAWVESPVCLLLRRAFLCPSVESAVPVPVAHARLVNLVCIQGAHVRQTPRCRQNIHCLLHERAT